MNKISCNRLNAYKIFVRDQHNLVTTLGIHDEIGTFIPNGKSSGRMATLNFFFQMEFVRLIALKKLEDAEKMLASHYNPFYDLLIEKPKP